MQIAVSFQFASCCFDDVFTAPMIWGQKNQDQDTRVYSTRQVCVQIGFSIPKMAMANIGGKHSMLDLVGPHFRSKRNFCIFLLSFHACYHVTILVYTDMALLTTISSFKRRKNFYRFMALFHRHFSYRKFPEKSLKPHGFSGNLLR